MFDFDRTFIHAPCPHCKFPNEVSMREVRFGLTIPCRGCKANIRLVQKDGTLDKTKKMLDDLHRMFNKTITIKL